MPAPIPSMRILEVHTCAKCGDRSDQNYAINGRVLCDRCEQYRIFNQDLTTGFLTIACIAAFILCAPLAIAMIYFF